METCARNREIPEDTVISMAQQETVFILLKHCQEMKRQESRWRLVTLFLVLGCAAVFFFTQRVIRDCNEKDTFTTAENSRQQAIDRQEQNLKPNAHLTTSSSCNSVPKDYIQWEHQDTGLMHMQNFTYDENKQALVVPQEGRYFVYVGVNFRMPDKDKVSGKVHFLSLKVLKYSNSYENNWPIMEVKDSIPDDRRGERRTMYTGQVVTLEEGDLLMVSIDEDNYELIDCSAETTMYIGAFLL
ncbi:tumor necrosis factor ligand superfamily member 15 [Coregonus clupeaformis]|uniref:tumor necrosis factor ligand superfamily member 15 n=1 Tax=Coregonus clupeaformis TaxID=59861 RepID=UPI001BE085A5|nr:tumor necrosis factor ligand superfamily member 15 [Coregonus clupeaformis]